MTLAFNWAQKQVDERVHRHPDWYFPDEKIFKKMNEERSEIEEALINYKTAPTEEHLKALKTEIGDELFALICLANKYNISLNECFDLMMQKNRDREQNDYKKEEK